MTEEKTIGVDESIQNGNDIMDESITDLALGPQKEGNGVLIEESTEEETGRPDMSMTVMTVAID